MDDSHAHCRSRYFVKFDEKLLIKTSFEKQKETESDRNSRIEIRRFFFFPF